MLEGHDIICFSNDWHQDPLSKHHIMSRLAKKNRVLWINSIGMRKPTLTAKDISKGYTKLKSFFSNRLEKINDNLYVMSPLVLPFHGNRAANFINRHILIWQARHYQHKLGIEKPILWTFLPNAVDVFGHMGEKLSLYYITDDFSKFTGHPSKTIARMEKDLLVKADVLIASSRHLADIKRQGKKIQFVSHGVNCQRFNQALNFEPNDYPADIKEISKPIIGFFGELNDWLNLKMLKQAAVLRPNWSFVLVGRVAVEVGDISYLSNLKNVHLLGQKKHDELPAYCAAFDVGLIPMKLNDLTVCVNPLKLREYLAAGLPVVSARLPEVEPYRDVVEFADDAEELVAAVERQLAKDRTVLKHQLSQRVAGETWDAKVEEISEIIQKALNEKS